MDELERLIDDVSFEYGEASDSYAELAADYQSIHDQINELVSKANQLLLDK